MAIMKLGTPFSQMGLMNPGMMTTQPGYASAASQQPFLLPPSATQYLPPAPRHASSHLTVNARTLNTGTRSLWSEIDGEMGSMVNAQLAAEAKEKPSPDAPQTLQLELPIAPSLRAVSQGDAQPIMFAASREEIENYITSFGNRHASVRACAVEALGKIGDGQAVELLITALGDEDADVRARASYALEKIGLSAVEPLMTALGDGDAGVRECAVEALGEIGDTRAVEPLMTALGDGDAGVRERAAEALGKIGDTRAVEPVMTALGDGDAGVRERAAEALGKIGDTRAVEPLIMALGDGDAGVRKSAAEALGKIGDARAVELLITALGDGDASVRACAVEALGKIGDAQAVELLITALGDNDKDVRRSAAYALGDIGDTRAVDPLLAAFGDEKAGIKRSAAYALSDIGDARAVEPLITVLGDRDFERRAEAAFFLGKIGDARAVEPIITLLGDREFYVRRLAAEALGKIGDARAVEPLIKLLDDRDADVRGSAAGALSKIGVLSLRQYLRDRSEGDRIHILDRFDSDFKAKVLRGLYSKENFEEVVQGLASTLCNLLGLENINANGGAVQSYGSVNMGQGLRLRQDMALSQRLVQDHDLSIDSGDNEVALNAMIRTLNFLVHHEVAHLVQKEHESRYPSPTIESDAFPLLAMDDRNHEANEVVIDKLAFDMARKLYVYGAGDMLFDEEMREAISIKSAFTLFSLVLENHRSDERPLTTATRARFIAVMQEMALSKNISPKLAGQLEQLSEDYRATVRSGHHDDAAFMAQFNKLVREYRRIFQTTELEV